MENLFVIHSANIYLFICFYYYIRHYTNQNKTKGEGETEPFHYEHV